MKSDLFSRVKERILQHREEKTSQGERLLAQSSLVEIDNDPVAFIHRLAERKRRMRLSHDVTEMWVGSEGRSLVENRLSHRRPHRFARLVEAQFEVLPDFAVRNVLETCRAESRVREERRQFEEREMVRGKNVERIPQEFVRAGSKMVECPALLEHRCEFRSPHEVGGFLFKRIESHGDQRIGGLNENQLVTQVTVLPPFAGIDRLQEKRRGITVEIEVEKPAIGLDVLLTQVPQERTLAGTGLAEDGNVHRAASLAQAHMPPRHLTVHDAKPEIETSRFLPCSAFPPSKPVPESLQKVVQ